MHLATNASSQGAALWSGGLGMLLSALVPTAWVPELGLIQNDLRRSGRQRQKMHQVGKVEPWGHLQSQSL